MAGYDVAIVGGGIFGCAVAKLLAERSTLDICLFEKEYHLAEHQSGRNSGTIHPGLVLDLKPGTRKAQFAIEGGRRLQEYCTERNLPMHDCGLMVVATTEAEVQRLTDVKDRVEALGVDVESLTADEVREREPDVRGRQALYTPESATVDSQQITYAFANDALEQGVQFYMGYAVRSLARHNTAVAIETDKGEVSARYIVNAAGVWAPQFATELGVAKSYNLVPLRGQYYELTPESRAEVHTNVYPTSMPPRIPNSVGVHFTRRPDGKVIVGPTGMIATGPDTYGRTEFDVDHLRRTVSSPGFWRFIRKPESLQIAWTEFNKTYRKSVFLNHCQRLVPQIRAEDLARSYVGIAPSFVDQNGTAVEESVFAKGPQSIHILRPKPGLTSALSIGEYVTEQVLNEV